MHYYIKCIIILKTYYMHYYYNIYYIFVIVKYTHTHSIWLHIRRLADKVN